MNFDKESKSDFLFLFFFISFFCGGGGGGGGDGGSYCYTIEKRQKSSHRHNVEHVVQSTFGNMLITLILSSLVSEF